MFEFGAIEFKNNPSVAKERNRMAWRTRNFLDQMINSTPFAPTTPQIDDGNRCDGRHQSEPDGHDERGDVVDGHRREGIFHVHQVAKRPMYDRGHDQSTQRSDADGRSTRTKVGHRDRSRWPDCDFLRGCLR